MQILWKRPFEQSDPIDTEGSGFYGRLHIFACQSPKWCRGLNLTLQLHLFFLLLPFIWLQLSYLFLQSLVYLRLYFCLPTLFSINKTKAKQTKHFPWFISLFIQEVHFEVSWGYSITQLEKKKSDKQVVQQKCGRLADKSLDRARSADIATRNEPPPPLQGGWWLAPWYLLGKVFDEQDFGGYVDAAPRFKSSMKHIFSGTVG